LARKSLSIRVSQWTLSPEPITSGIVAVLEAKHPIRTFMRPIIGWLLCSLSVLAVDTNEIRVVRRTDNKVSPGYLVTYEEFTRSGQTNLLRITSVKDGITNSIAHNFYYRGAYVGRYSQSGGYTFVNSAASAPYVLALVWDASNQIRAASVTTTNYVTLDSFDYTNGGFFPVTSSIIEESNRKTRGILQR
jgi:hypothetical protein